MKPQTPDEQIRSSLAMLARVMPAVGIISAVVNVLALTGSLYMLQVYDRVLTSRSLQTLVLLSVLTVGLFLFQGALETIRGMIFLRLGSRLDRRLSPLAHRAVMQMPLLGQKPNGSLQPIQDVDTIRSFLQGQGPIAIFDIPWMPIYIGVVFLLHPLLGWVTLIGAAILLALTLITEMLVQKPAQTAVAASRERSSIAESSQRNSEVLHAMGFAERFHNRFLDANVSHLAAQERLSKIVGGLSVASKIFRVMLQSALLGLGAYLALRNEMTIGAIIACSITASRALAPIEIAIAHWRGFVAARQSASRFRSLLAKLPMVGDPLALPAPSNSLSVENVTIQPPGGTRTIVSNASFNLRAGQVLAVIGPSAAGKSTLARALAGVWPPTRGSIRLDGAALDRWSAQARGQHIGYLPQDVQLLSGTITENIARFDVDPDSRAVIAAAQAADVHDMILRLPEGYETRIGYEGCELSGGQRQRIALARALYRDPFMVVLDEPNSNLDAEGEAALTEALKKVAARGGIAVVIAHRPSVLAAADTVALLSGGQIGALGPRDEILRKVLRQGASSPGQVLAPNQATVPVAQSG
ncbi:MAG: type I secretion system permease/ATPase [Hyphomicrobiales bacterium]|nr:type I secretion system permease/ATPase [Hyphomicrobiales bacterium]